MDAAGILVATWFFIQNRVIHTRHQKLKAQIAQ